MEHIKNFFVEFKSIFVTDDVLKENEAHANIVTASAMLNSFLIGIIVYLLVYFNIFKIGTAVMNVILIRSIILLLIPAILCFVLKGNKKWLKASLFICFTLMLAMTDAFLKNNVTLIIVLPIILAARYYNKKFTIGIAILTVLAFTISTYMSINLGQQDLSSYNLIIPEGTNITINTTLRDAVMEIDTDSNERLKNIFLHQFLPKIFLYSAIAFACVQISQSGKKMIEHQEEISKKGARIETELNLANGIQKNMLPSIFPPFPEHKEIDIYASMTPAKEVGGDFYDMFLVDKNHLGLVMADVSGKGIPAALFMMISKTLIKNVSSVEREVNQVFNRVNKMLCDGNKYGLFVTAWYGLLDLETGKLDFVNAGHNPPLVYRKQQDAFQYLKTKPNMVLAGLEKTNYQKYEIQLEPGDKLFLYTDGVVEATNTSNQLYGETRLLHFLNQHINVNSQDTIEGLKKDIDSFVGKAEQFDDITMLEMHYKKRKTEDSYEIENEFKADIKELPNVQSFIQNVLKKYECSPKMIMQVNLVVEEIFVNIAKYAYQEGKGSCKVITDYDGHKEIKIVFEDNGIPFNPLEREDPDVTLPAEEREIGGLGIFITKKIMNDVTYQYENNKNILLLKKIKE